MLTVVRMVNRRIGGARRGSGPTGRPGALTTLLVAPMAVAASCGGTTEPAIGNDTVPVTAPSTTTTTEPPTTTTTIDFDRRPDQETVPLAVGAGIDEVVAVVDDMRGPTADVADQLNRLAPFPDIDSPPAAQVLDLSVSVAPAEDGRNQVTALARLRAPQTAEELVRFHHDEMRAEGWNRARTTTDNGPDGPFTEQVFRIPGLSGDTVELIVTVTDGPVSIIELAYTGLTEADDPSLVLLTAWQDGVRLPGSASITAATIATADDTATLTVTHRVVADSPGQARADVLSLVRSSEFTTDAAADGGEQAQPVELVGVEAGDRYLLDFAATREPEVVEVLVSASAGLDPVD